MEELRKEINETDEKLLALFAKRMEISGRIARYKEEKGLAVRDAEREGLVLERARKAVPEELGSFAESLFETLMKLSREYQGSLLERPVALIGMPGCGKSEIGRAMASRLGRDYIDTDEVVRDISGLTPEEMILQKGEEEFRRVETQALSQTLQLRGAIVSTGGGIIVKEENRKLLGTCRSVVFLRRETFELETQGRPLSQGDGAVERLYKVRLPLYLECADVQLDIRGTPELMAEKIISACCL